MPALSRNQSRSSGEVAGVMRSTIEFGNVQCSSTHCGQRRVEPGGGGQRGAPSRVSVRGQVVAAQDRDRAGGPVAPDRERSRDAVERRALTGGAIAGDGSA